MPEVKYISAIASKSGFFNSKEGTQDRVYNAEDMATIFDGIIKDGVYADYGEKFAVKAKTATTVTIDTGRAWFNKTWFVNDSKVILQLSDPLPNPSMGRYDAVAIEVNTSPDIRATQLVYIVGDGGTTYSKPTMEKGTYINQYPLAYINFEPGTTEITDANIEIVVGTDACPFVTGILEHTDINDLLAGWNVKAEEMIQENDDAFNTWFNSTRETLDSDVAGHLQNEIEQLNDRLNAFGDAEELVY